MIGLGEATLGAAGLQTATGLLNTYLQWRQMQYQKDLQNDIFNREDTSIWRRVTDLKRSGLSPVLAAGQGAGTGGTVAVNAPQFNATDALSMLKMKQDIDITEAQKKLIAAQIRDVSASASIKEWDNSIFRNSGMSSNAAGWAKEIRDSINLLRGNIIPKIPPLKGNENLKRQTPVIKSKDEMDKYIQDIMH